MASKWGTAFVPADGTGVVFTECPVCGGIFSNESQHKMTDQHKLAAAALERKTR